MKKNLFTPPPDNGLTYHENRECRNCGTAIADQEHATRTHCPKTYDEFGRVIDCKTTLARINDRADRELQRKLINNQKFISSRIDILIEKKGNEVHTSDLTAYDVKLSQCIDYNIESNGTLTSLFLKHRIVSNPITNLHKIDIYE